MPDTVVPKASISRIELRDGTKAHARALLPFQYNGKDGPEIERTKTRYAIEPTRTKNDPTAKMTENPIACSECFSPKIPRPSKNQMAPAIAIWLPTGLTTGKAESKMPTMRNSKPLFA